MKQFLTLGQCNENAIFRISRISKLLTTYAFFAEFGTRYSNDLITKWVPELTAIARSHDQTGVYGEIRMIVLSERQLLTRTNKSS